MGQLNVTNPFDGSPVGEVKLSLESDVDLALSIAEKTHRSNRKGLPRHEKSRHFEKSRRAHERQSRRTCSAHFIRGRKITH